MHEVEALVRERQTFEHVAGDEGVVFGPLFQSIAKRLRVVGGRRHQIHADHLCNREVGGQLHCPAAGAAAHIEDAGGVGQWRGEVATKPRAQ